MTLLMVTRLQQRPPSTPLRMLLSLDLWVPAGDIISFCAVDYRWLHLEKTLAPSRDGLSRVTVLSWDLVID